MSDKLCVIPWTHLNIDPDGKVYACCITTPYNQPVGDLNKQTINQIWNGNELKTLRKQLLNNEEPEMCTRCFDRERVSDQSVRIHQNAKLKKHFDKIKDVTEEDGSTPLNLVYWDFRFSNLCNLKCRSCGPVYSSAWLPDFKKLYPGSEAENFSKVTQVNQVNLTSPKKFIDENINKVEMIYFAGGEPLMMDEHWYILEQLTKLKRSNVHIHYNTNFSLVKYKGKNAFDYWKKFNKNKVELWPSIDEIEDRAELIRSGTNWKKIDENFKEVSKHLDHIIVKPSITVGAMNVFRIPTIIDYFKSHGIDYVSVNMINFPHFYNVAILPQDFRKKIKEDIKQYAFLNRIPQSVFTELFSDLDRPQDIEGAKLFIRHNAKLDKIRNESIYEVIPELECVKECFIV